MVGYQLVATDGSDSNSGLSWADAKLTLGSALSELTGGGIIRIGAGVFNVTATVEISTSDIIIEGSGIGVTTLASALPGTYEVDPSGVPSVSAPGTTLPSSQTPAAMGSTSIVVCSTANILTASAVFIGGPTDEYGLGNPSGERYPYGYMEVTSIAGTTITGTMASGGGVTYPSGAYVVAAPSDTILVNAPNVIIRDLTIDGSAVVAASGAYPLSSEPTTATDLLCERLQILGYANYAFGPNYEAAFLQAARNVWRDCRSSVYFYGSDAVDCIAEGCTINVTSGFATAIQAGAGAAGVTIRNNNIVNAVALNSPAGLANGIRVTGQVGTTVSSAAVEGGSYEIPVLAWPGFSVGAGCFVFIGCAGSASTGTPGTWELRAVSSASESGLTVSFTYPLQNNYPSGVEVAALTYSDANLIANNVISSSGGAGIVLSTVSGSRVEGNLIGDAGNLRPDHGPSTDSIDVLGCFGVVVADNSCEHQGGYGINLSGTSAAPGSCYNTLSGNRIFDSGDPAITLQGTNDSAVKANVVSGASFGITLGEAEAPSSRNVVQGNHFDGCDWGGFVIEASSQNAVADNEFVNCGWNSTARTQGDSIGYIFDSFVSGVPGSIGNRVERNRIGRSVQGFNPSSPNVGPESETSLAYYPPGGLMPKYFVRSAPISGTGEHTVLSSGISLPATVIGVASVTGFPTSGAIYLFSATAPITYWTGVKVNCTGVSTSPPEFTGCSGGSGSFASGAIVGDTLFPALTSGYNEVRGNTISHVARRPASSASPNELLPTDVNSGDIFSDNVELIFNFSTGTSVVVGGTGASGSVITTDHSPSGGPDCYQLATGSGGTYASAYFTVGFASGWLAGLANLPDDAEFEIDMKMIDSNINNIYLRFSEDGSSANSISSGPFRASTNTPQIEASGSGWVTYRWRKGDMLPGGTAAWNNIAGLSVVIEPVTTSVSTTVRFDNLVVCPVG